MLVTPPRGLLWMVSGWMVSIWMAFDLGGHQAAAYRFQTYRFQHSYRFQDGVADLMREIIVETKPKR
jgi:hypothetical protein